MNFTLEQKNAFTVKAKAIRTSNGENKFGEVWNQFLSDYKGGDIVGLYTDYENDFSGKFTFAVGTVSESSGQSDEYEIKDELCGVSHSG